MEGNTLGGLDQKFEPDQSSEGSEEDGKAALAPLSNEGIWTAFNKYVFSLALLFMATS